MNSKLFVIVLFVVAISVQISSVQANKERLAHEVQNILNTGNPYCVVYRDAVNAYLMEYAPTMKCQMRCNNRDDDFAQQFPGWYIPSNFPFDHKDCRKNGNCSLKFDEEWSMGTNFLTKARDAEVFLNYVMRKLNFCQK